MRSTIIDCGTKRAPSPRPLNALWLSVVLAFYFGLIATHADAAEQESFSVPWTTIGEDLEIAQVTIPVNALFSSEVVLFRSALKEYRVGVVKATEFGWKRNNVKNIGQAAKAVLAVNANFFDETGKPLGLIISRGILNQGIHRGGGTLGGIFALIQGTPTIINRAEFNSHTVTEAVQAGPRLLANGSKVRGVRDDDYSRRAGVCVDAQHRVVIYCVSSGFLGMSIGQVQDLLLTPSIQCTDALNLDGGGSAQLYVSGDILKKSQQFDEIHIPGTDPVPVVLALFRREG